MSTPNSTPKRPKREPILVALHGDGFVEVFGSKAVDIKFVDVPHSPGAEALAEDYVERELPHRYRQLYYPGFVRATAMHRPLLPSRIQESQCVERLVRGLSEVESKEAAA